MNPHCIDPRENIQLTGRFARYAQLRDYSDLLDRTDIGATIIDGQWNNLMGDPELAGVPLFDVIFAPYNERKLSFGLFEVDCEDRIRYRKCKENSDRNLFGMTLSNEAFSEFMKNDTRFKNYFELYMIKAVQDRMVTGRKGSFKVLMTLGEANQEIIANQFHQDMMDLDNGEMLKVDFFTLTYLLPSDKVILGASLLIDSTDDFAGLQAGEYASITFPVKGLTTLIISNYENEAPRYHSTPSDYSGVPCGEDLYESRPARLEGRPITLNRIQLPAIDDSHRPAMNAMLRSTREEKRDFARCLYLSDIDVELYDESYEILVDMRRLERETRAVEKIDVKEVRNYVNGGGKKNKITFKEASKILQDPDKKIMLSYGKHLILKAMGKPRRKSRKSRKRKSRKSRPHMKTHRTL